MRGTWFGSLVVCLVLAFGQARADEQAEAQKVIDKAVQGLGGEAQLAKAPAVTFKAKGSLTVEGLEITVQADTAWQGLDHCRLDLEAQVAGQTQNALLVMGGDKAWAQSMGRTDDLPKEILPMLLGDVYAFRLTQSLVPLKDKAYTLSPLGEVKIGNRPALGVKVKCKERPEVDLYFDKENGLPVKFELRVAEPDGNEALHEFLLAEYKDAGGLKHFTKLTISRDGKKTVDLELSEIKRQEKLDDTLFAKPG